MLKKTLLLHPIQGLHLEHLSRAPKLEFRRLRGAKYRVFVMCILANKEGRIKSNVSLTNYYRTLFFLRL